MSLQTPDCIRRLQRKIYLKAKAEPAFRFYLLYDKICREDILRHAYALARANRGAPGVDGVTFTMIETAGLVEWLAGLRKDLVAKTYRPEPVLRVMIPKPGGGERPLGIPTALSRKRGSGEPPGGVGCLHGAAVLLPPSLPACGYPARDLAIPPVHTELPRR
jgi:RNA-directed DNA polymerase